MARAWNCKPWEVDEALEDGRRDEIALEIHLTNIEQHWEQVRAKRQQSKR